MPSEDDALAALAVPPPVRPMLAKAMHALPDGHHWIFEPKWDGFRTLVFRSGDELLLQSRDLKPMNRYFPELLEPLAAHLPQRCVLDGEVVVATDSGLDFEALQQRIHPAASRVAMLAERTPARSWRSTCWPRTTPTFQRPASPNGARRWRASWPAVRRHCTSRP